MSARVHDLRSAPDLPSAHEEIRRLRQELAACREELRGTGTPELEAHDDLLRMVSHEMRTPISTLQLSVRMLAREPSLESAQRLRDGLERIENSARRIHQLVDTVTEWTRARRQRELRVAPIDLDALLEQVVSTSTRAAERRGLRIVLHLEDGIAPLTSNEPLLRLVVDNLLTRAIRLSSDGPLEVHAAARDGWHRVVVTDRGPATRAPKDHARGSDSGLALAVLRDLAHTLGGDLHLEPGPKHGNAAILTIPSRLASLDELRP